MRALGVNTGTSVDAVDMCLVQWNLADLKTFTVIKEKTYPFDKEIQIGIEKLINSQKGSLEEISNLNFKYSYFIADLIKEFREEAISDTFHKLPTEVRNDKDLIELVGMHGQTIFHGDDSTFQIGDGSLIANRTGIMTVSDFRPADMALGGGGAPISSYLDDVLVRNEIENTGTLNIGGIANLTIMEKEKPTIAYDTGPGNTLIDTLMNKLYQQKYDKDGEVAFQGNPDNRFITNLIKHNDYFHQEPPKTTGREFFSEKFADKFLDLGKKENIISTVSQFTVETISHELSKHNIKKLYVSGGGTQNKYLMQKLKEANSYIEFLSHKELDIDDHYKEAMLFSLLAYTSFNKKPNNIPSSTGASAATILGKISYVSTD